MVEIIEQEKFINEKCSKNHLKYVEIIEDQKVEDIKRLKSSIIKSDAIRILVITENELRVIVMLRGVKNYENLSKSSLIKEINKIKLSEEPKKHLKKYSKKSFRVKKSVLFRKKEEILSLSLEKKVKNCLKLKNY